ncbi:phage holin family protein [Pseudomonas solani]
MEPGMESGPQSAGQGPSPRRLGAAFLGLLHSHVELFGIELQEQKANTLRLLLFAGLSLIFALLLLVALSALLLVLFWDSARIETISGLCLFYFLLTGYCAWRLKQAVDDESSPFSATLEELAQDRERLMP